MVAQTKSLEDAVALTLALSARLTFVLIFLILQIYALALQVYKVSKEEVPGQVTSPWQRGFIHVAFLGFLKRQPGVQDPIRPQTTPGAGATTTASNGTSKRQGDSVSVLNSDRVGNSIREENSNGARNPVGTSNSAEVGADAATADEECEPSWTSLWVQGNTVLLFVVGIALSIPTFNKLKVAQEGLNTQCKAPIDGDIAGDGVRAALWVQQGVLWLSVATGVFLKPSQPRPTAVKELAAGLVVTHLSLAIAVLVQIGQRTLTPLDAALVVMILDAQNSALAVSFASRETLAARWEVVSISVAQLFGLVVIGVVLARFQEGTLVTEECGCFSYFWWAWQSTCTALPTAERAVLWAYYVFRWLNSAMNWHFGVRYMWIFNLLEQDKTLWDGVRPTADTEGTPGVPASIGFYFLQNMVFGLVSSVAAELTIAGFTSGDEPKPFTVGQITAMVIAVTTTFRGAWLFIRRFDLLPLVEEKIFVRGDQTEDINSSGSEPHATADSTREGGQSLETDTEQVKVVRQDVVEPGNRPERPQS